MTQDKANLAQRTAEVLRRKIYNDKQYALGSKLPNENELSQELGVSRTTLREAIRILVAEGVLHVQRGKGTYVNEVKDQLSDPLPSFQEQKVALKDLYEARLIIEPAAAALACERATDEEIEEIVQLVEATQEQFTHDYNNEEIIQREKAFHDALIRASHNKVFDHFIPVVNQTIEKTFELEYKWEAVAEGAYNDNFMIIDFLRKRDAEALRSVMTIHLHRAIWTEQLME
jgi:GntR family transcriptional regulator, transcriptional repressor for pyruvate dehydrogenase complex